MAHLPQIMQWMGAWSSSYVARGARWQLLSDGFIVAGSEWKVTFPSEPPPRARVNGLMLYGCVSKPCLLVCNLLLKMR
ncbi:hypothetical protein EVAR_60985_1 [Eumeta japonica]|uniref:Uncharacterized protein n=1 Tax=Eumeta variegata TaxID=151549 RepID=A0A4C1XTS6_EUMVA|nr:hypothetical protein EVAR_60985_1 [Eumeta japonica]